MTKPQETVLLTPLFTPAGLFYHVEPYSPEGGEVQSEPVIVRPEVGKARSKAYRVRCVGPGAYTPMGVRVPLSYVIDDILLVDPDKVTEVRFCNDSYMVVAENFVYGKVGFVEHNRG